MDAPEIWRKIVKVLALPMRRELIRPWFRIVARTGSVGEEESFLDPDPKDHWIDGVMRATRDGELFLFVNDAVPGIPGLEGVFYSNNVGRADVTVSACLSGHNSRILITDKAGKTHEITMVIEGFPT
jgi:hypothetical protein